jgi:hypothetical protein
VPHHCRAYKIKGGPCVSISRAKSYGVIMGYDDTDADLFREFFGRRRVAPFRA